MHLLTAFVPMLPSYIKATLYMLILRVHIYLVS